jgi:hypothetical protein
VASRALNILVTNDLEDPHKYVGCSQLVWIASLQIAPTQGRVTQAAVLAGPF